MNTGSNRELREHAELAASLFAHHSRVHLAGCTAHPDEAWVTQQARQVAWGLVEREEPVRCLIRDRDRKFTSRFDAVFEAQGARVVRTPCGAKRPPTPDLVVKLADRRRQRERSPQESQLSVTAQDARFRTR